MFRAGPLLASVVVISFAVLTMWRVKHDYAARGRLTLSSTVLQFVMFALHALASYSFLDSRMSEVETARPSFALAVVLSVTHAVPGAHVAPQHRDKLSGPNRRRNWGL